MTAAIRGYLGDDATVSGDAIHYIATLSDGAMRDALSILDQCLSFYGDETVTLDKARQLLGAVDRQVLFDFADALTACDISRVLTLINSIVKDGRDVSQFVSDFVRHLRDLLVASQTDGLDLLEYIDEVRQALAAQSKRLPLGVTIHYIYTFSELQRDLRFAPHTRTALEVCAVKLCKPQEACAAPVQEAAKPMQVQEAVKSVQVQEVVKPVQEAVKPVQEAVKPVQEAVKLVQEAVKPVEPQTPPTAAKTPLTPEILTDIQKGWSTFCKSDIFTMPEIIRLSQTGLEISNRQLQVICGDEINMKRLKSEQKKLSEGLMHAFSLDTAPNLAFVVRDAYNKPDTPQEAVAREEEADAWADLGAQVEIESEW
jgi:DNA polymerase III gamma/tau subunit